MALDRLTKIDGGGISTTSDYRVGVITATKFVGPIEGSITATDATFSGNVSIAGTLTYEDVINVDSVGIGTFREGIFLPDNKKLQFGNAAGSADLEIFHSSSENKTIIDNNTNDLDIASDVIRLKNSARSETLATFVGNGGVSLYYDNSIKLGTAGWGIQATGILKIADATNSSGATNHLALGASNDLKLFHDGSHNRIHGSTGFLDINNSADLISITASNRIDISDDFIRLRSRDGSDVYMTGTVNSSVDLYFNGSKKFETLTSGVQVTGTFAELVFNCLNGTGKQYKFRASGTNSTGFELFDITLNQRAYLYHDSTYLGGVHHFHTNGTLRFAIEGPHVNIANDTTRLRIGASADLQIYHDGSNSYISDSGTGALTIEASTLLIENAAGNQNMIQAHQSGAVNLYYANSKKLETTNSGVTVTGGVTASGFTLGDNQNINFGASNDLRIFHNGNHSYIADVGTGDLRITGSAVHIQNAAQSENMIRCFENAQVELFYDNSRKFETTSAGVNILGITTTTQLAVTGVSTFTGMLNANGDMTITSPSPTINFTENNGDPDYRMFVNGGIFTLVDTTNNIDRFSVTSSRITLNDTVLVNDNILYIGDRLVHWTDDDTMIRFHSADKCRIELGGVTAAFSGLKSTSGAPHAKWGINVATPQAALHIDEGYNHQGVLRVTNGNQNSGYYHQLEMSGTNNVFTLWRHFDGSSFNNTHAHGSTGHIWYIGGNEKVRVHSDGNVGIGTNNPGQKLHVEGGSIRIRGTGSNETNGQVDFGDDYRILKYTDQNTMTLQSPYDVVINIDNNGNNTDAKFLVKANTTNPESGGTELFQVQENGNVHIGGKLGIGVNAGSPSYPVQIHESDNTAYAANATVAQLAVGNVNSSSATNSAGIHLFTDGNGRGVVNLSALNNSTSSSADFVIQTRHSATLAERFRIGSTGQTTIQSAINQTLILNNTISNGQSSIQFQSAGTARFIIGSNKDGDGNPDFFIFDDTNDKHRFNINASGNVGIGSDTPVAHLDVASSQNIETLRLRDKHFNKYLTIRGGGSPNRMVIDSYEGGGGGAAIDLASNGDTKVRITADGKVGINDNNPANNFVVKAPGGSGHCSSAVVSGDASTKISMQVAQGTEGRFGMTTNHPLAIYSGGLERLRITSAGLVSIGETNPSSDVTFTVRKDVAAASGNASIQINNLYQGTANQSNQSGAEIEFKFKNHNAAHNWWGGRILCSNNDNYNQYSHLEFHTASQGNAVERMRLNHDGDLTIFGKDNAELKLKCGTSTGNNIIAFQNSGGTTKGNITYDSDNNFLLFNVNEGERLRIDNDLVNIKGCNLHVGQDGATANFTDSNNGNTKHIEIGATGGGDALLTTHSSGFGIGYFGYEAGGDRLIIACDDGGGANKIDFITSAGTSTGGGSDNLNGKKPKMRIKSGGGGVQIFVHESATDFQPKSDVTALLIQNGQGGGDIGSDSEPTHIDWAWVDSNSNVTPQCRISGNVGNGGDPNSLELEGKGFLTFHCSDSNAVSGDLNPPQRLRIAHNGTFTGSSSNNISDQRLKENIATITDPIAKIKALKGRTFTWKSEARMREGTHYGFVAQEVESVIPDLIVDDTGIRVFDKDDNLQPSNVITPPVGGGYAKSVDSDGVTPVLVEALKEALARIETLEAEVAALKSS